VGVVCTFFLSSGDAEKCCYKMQAHLGDHDKWPLVIYVHSASPSTYVGCRKGCLTRIFEWETHFLVEQRSRSKRSIARLSGIQNKNMFLSGASKIVDNIS